MVARRAFAKVPVQPTVTEVACSNAVAGVPPSVSVILVSLTAVSAAGVTLGGTAQVASALKKFVVPPPLAGASPLSVLVNTSSSVVACVPVRSCGSPVPAATRPRIVAVATSASLALVTALLAIVVALLSAAAVTSPVKAALIALTCPAVVQSQVMAAASVTTRSADNVASALLVRYSAVVGAPPPPAALPAVKVNKTSRLLPG